MMKKFALGLLLCTIFFQETKAITLTTTVGDGTYVSMSTLTLIHFPGEFFNGFYFPPYDKIKYRVEFKSPAGWVWNAAILLDGEVWESEEFIQNNEVWEGWVYVYAGNHAYGTPHTISIVALSNTGFIDFASRNIVHP